MRTVSKLLVAMMLAAGTTTIVLTPAVAEEKKTVQARSHGEVNPADCKAAAPGKEGKEREKVAAGSAMPAGQVNPADCKATPPAKSGKTRATVKKETKEAAKAGELTPPGEVIKR